MDVSSATLASLVSGSAGLAAILAFATYVSIKMESSEPGFSGRLSRFVVGFGATTAASFVSLMLQLNAATPQRRTQSGSIARGVPPVMGGCFG